MGKALGLNPYLPFWETVPDGEPHVFDGRIYIYGSHDTLNGSTFCDQDYAAWSAPVEDPGNWRYEGVSYRASQDPFNGAPLPDGSAVKEVSKLSPMPMGTPEHPHYLYAPDCCKGPDGRYYLYYALDFVGVISVAVSDRPEGPFTFLDYVTRADGTLPEIGIYFDPAILCEKEGDAWGIYLYYGFAPQVRYAEQKDRPVPGGLVVRLSEDMHTILSDPVVTANGCETAKGTSFEAHPFFEASSIRHFGDWYYFVYSSLQGHELAYAMAKSPEGPFTYKGVIVSNADVGYKGNPLPTNYWGNNHGGLVQFGGKTWIFWHRQTHGNEFSRQGCADEVQILEDGTIPQIEITSCGLNGGPLPAKGIRYSAHIACAVMAADREKMCHVLDAGPGEPVPENPPEMPYITEERTDPENGEPRKNPTGAGYKGLSDPEASHSLKPYIANLREGAAAGFKYFLFDGTEKAIRAEIRGAGVLKVTKDDPDGKVIARLSPADGDKSNAEDLWQTVSADISWTVGKHALFFVTEKGQLDLAGFEIL